MPKQTMRHFYLGMVVNEFRRMHGLSLRDVAGMIGCSASYVLNLERGEIRSHDVDKLLELCDLMSVDIRDLFTNVGWESSKND